MPRAEAVLEPRSGVNADRTVRTPWLGTARVFFDCRALSPIPPTWAHRAGDSPVPG
jgi:hypothetical protein